MRNSLLITVLLLTGVASAQEERRVAPPPPPPPGPVQVVSEENEIVDFPDVDAEFLGGPEAMKQYIQENVVYPEISRKVGDQGRVYISFIVEIDGSISDVKVMRGVTVELNEEAMRVVRNMPRWKPAEVQDKKVRARCRLPITFILTTDTEEETEKK